MSKSPLKKYFEKSAYKRTYDPKTRMFSKDDRQILDNEHTSLVDSGIKPGTEEYNKLMNERKQSILTHDTQKIVDDEVVDPGHTLEDVRDDYKPKYRY